MPDGHHPIWRQQINDTIDFFSRRCRSLFFSLCIVVIVGLFLTVTVFKTFRWQHPYGDEPRLTFRGDAGRPKTNGHFVKQSHVADERYYDVTRSSVNRTPGPRRGVKQKKKEKRRIQWDDPRLDILHLVKPQFDQRFQNPCWYEALNSPYQYDNNSFATYSPAAKNVLEQLTENWEEIFEDAYESSEEHPVVSRLRCLPYFLIIGQPKCGSTDLFWKIAKHPDIDTPPIKELHWWSRNRQGRRFNYTKIIPFEDYVDMFDRVGIRIDERLANITDKDDSEQDKGSPNQIITGEASVSLFWDNNVWMNFPENGNQSEPLYIVPHYIRHMLPDVKLILILREPTERMFSDYLYFHSSSKSAEEFHKLVKNAIVGFTECFHQSTERACVYNSNLYNSLRLRLQVGLYSVFLSDWFKVFPRDQFYVIRLEDYSAEPLKIIRQIYRFFGLRDITPEEEQVLLQTPMSNVRKSSDRQIGGMLPETRTLLNNFYRPFNVRLAQMLQDDIYLWDDVT